jgi:hypothetical protein
MWLGLLVDAVQESIAWTGRLVDRLVQIVWVLDHLADLDADFLAIYRIDLEEDDISGPRFFSLAHRLPAYSGVMAARIEAERDQQDDRPAPTAAPRQTADSGETKEVSLTAFRVMFPGIVSSSEA